jgi:protein gp37
MSEHTGIEWTDATWNPITGCTKVSPGCEHCYAQTFAERFRGVPGHHFERGFEMVLRPERLDQPLRWRRPRRIFVNSMSDLFHAAVPDEFIARVFAVMAHADRHTFQVLTKRPARMRSLLSSDRFWYRVGEQEISLTFERGSRWDWDGQPLSNVWLGVSAEDQHWADVRVPALLDTPAAVRFVSAEPLVGAVDLSRWLRPAPGCGFVGPDGCCEHPHNVTPECHTVVRCPVTAGWRGLDWVIAGGESGPAARAMHPDWARDLRDQCAAAYVPFLFKQWGAHNAHGQRVGKHAAGRVLDGRTYDQYPAPGHAEHDQHDADARSDAEGMRLP